MQEGKLTRLWVRASASLPLGWRLAGVISREIAAQWAPAGSATGEDEWVALALEAGGQARPSEPAHRRNRRSPISPSGFGRCEAIRMDSGGVPILVVHVRRQLDA